MNVKSYLNVKHVIPILLLGMFSACTVNAETSSELLERAIYTEETVGDLPSAIKMYDDIIKNADKNKANVATAMYRQSICYKLQGDSEKSTELLTQLISKYPKQTDIVADARVQLKNLKATSLNLEPAPWLDGEETYYSIYLPTGKKIGTMTTSSQSSTFMGKDVWVFENTIIGGNQLNSSVTVDKDSFYPLSASEKSPQLGYTDIQYGSNEIAITYKKDKSENKTRAVSGPIYDAAQINNLFRRLPLTKNYSASISIYQGLANFSADMNIRVSGTEVLTLAGKKIECFKIDTAFLSKGVEIKKSTSWIADTPSRDIVKVDDGGPYFILDRVIVSELSESKRKRVFSDYGFSLSTPKDRQIVDMSFRDSSVELLLGIFKPGFNDRVNMFMITPEKDDATAKMRIPENKLKFHYNAIKRKAKSVRLRKDVSTEFFVSGVKTVGFVADVTEGKKEGVVANIYFAKGNNLFYFSMNSDKSSFDKKFQQLKNIMEGFKFI